VNIILSRPFNLLAFNLMWLGCVLGREQLLWLVAPLVIAYSALLIGSGRVNVYQLAIPALLGVSADTLLTVVGIFQFNNTILFIPLWLSVLWLAFATTLTQSLQWLGKHKLVAAAIGAVAVPFNYAVGERLGAVSFPGDYLFTMLVLGALWALLLPLLFTVAENLAGKRYAAN
jgi:hypothetical protein